ncbi:MAG TPA: hypothetical protein PKY96_16315, partial [Flavobacteriales bacterium]|nr:hypothetical protein [Flavobacteriales bacterium]
AVLLALAAWHFALRVQLITDHGVNLGGVEINVVYGAQKILLGRPLYEDPEQPPFDVMQYSPLYYGLLASVAKIAGVQPEETFGLFVLSRTLALLLNLLTCWLVFALCRALGCTRWGGLAVALFSFVLYTDHFYGRGDALYAMLFVAALLAHARVLDKAGPRAMVLAALLSVACVLAKQTGVLVIGIIGLDLLLRRAWRELRVFAIAVLAVSSMAALVIAVSASGPYFLKNAVQGLANGIAPSMYREFHDLATYKYYAPMHMALLVLVVRGFWIGDARDRLLSAAMALSIAFGGLTAFKSGSNLNYLYEAHLLVSIAAMRLVRGTSGWLSMAPLLVMLAFAQHRTRLLHKHVADAVEREGHAAAHRSDIAVHHALVNELGLRPQDKVLITYRGHLELLLNGQGLIAQKDVIQWSVREVYDLSEFLRMMDDGEVRYVIGDSPRDTLQFRSHVWTPITTVLEVEGRYVQQVPGAGP